MKVITTYLSLIALLCTHIHVAAVSTSHTSDAMKEESSSQDDSLFWGTYRPIPYVGLRSRSEDSPLVGLMWYKPSNPEGVYNLRHDACYRDNMTKYGWTQHNGESYGR